jgi:Uma2 family endonuclease
MEEPTVGRTVAQGAPKLTYEDLVLLPDDGKRHELIDGAHFVTPSPNTRHQAIVTHLAGVLDAFVRARGLGRAFVAPYDVVFSPCDVVEPDLIFVSAARLEVLTAAHAVGAPDLVIEILSPSTRRRDEVLKRDLYEARGVAEYWLIDPEAETVKVLRREGERFGRARLLSLRDGDVLETALLPGLELPLATVFED